MTLMPVADLDLVDDVHALGDLAERRVLAVEEVRVAEHEIDLARRGVGSFVRAMPSTPAVENGFC